jgi:hypothetical protein
LLLTTTCAVGMGVFVARNRRERAAIDWLNDRGAKIAIEPSGPLWLRRLIGEKFFEHVVEIQWWEFGPPRVDGEPGEHRLNDEDITKLLSLPNLRSLNLYGVQVTDELLQTLEELPALKELFFDGERHCTVAGVERLADAHPDWDIDPAFAEHLYHVTVDEYETGRLTLRDAILSMQIAADWKLACAKFKTVRRAEVAAYEQHVDWLGKLHKHVEHLASMNDPGGGAKELALARCAVACSRLELARAQQSRAAEAAAVNAGREAEELLARVNAPPPSGVIDAFDVVSAWRLAFPLLLAQAEQTGEQSAKSAVLRRQAQDLQQLVGRIEALYDAEQRGGETEKRDLSRIALALAEAQLARAENDGAAMREALSRAQSDARELRAACLAAYEVGAISTAGLAFCWQQADELESALARVTDDRMMEEGITHRTMAQTHRWFLKASWAAQEGGGTGTPVCIPLCLYATGLLKLKGEKCFSGAVSDCIPHFGDGFDDASYAKDGIESALRDEPAPFEMPSEEFDDGEQGNEPKLTDDSAPTADTEAIVEPAPDC